MNLLFKFMKTTKNKMSSMNLLLDQISWQLPCHGSSYIIWNLSYIQMIIFWASEYLKTIIQNNKQYLFYILKFVHYWKTQIIMKHNFTFFQLYLHLYFSLHKGYLDTFTAKTLVFNFCESARNKPIVWSCYGRKFSKIHMHLL